MDELLGHVVLDAADLLFQVDVQVPWNVHVRPAQIIELLAAVELGRFHLGRVVLVFGRRLAHGGHVCRRQLLVLLHKLLIRPQLLIC